MPDYFLCIDAGTSGCKVGIGDSKGNLLQFVKKKWTYYFPEELEPYGAEFNPEEFWSIIANTAKEVISESKIPANEIKGIGIASQRHGCVFINGEGKELYGGPNRDARGLEVDVEDYIDEEELYEITGQNPPFLYALARYLWFKENQEEIFKQIDKILTIDSWIAYKLTGKLVIDYSSASATQLLNVKTLQWSSEIIEKTKINKNILPDLVEAGTKIGTINQSISQEIELSSEVFVTLAGGDSQSAIIGCGAIQRGDITIVAGSTMPIMQIVDSPILDVSKELWTDCSCERNKWVIEANAGPAGNLYDWYIEKFIAKASLETDAKKIFNEMVKHVPPTGGEVYADLGPQIFNNQSITEITSSKFIFPPVSISLDSPVGVDTFARALLENLGFVVRANINKICQTSSIPIGKVFLVGGLAKVPELPQIIASILNSNIILVEPESTLVGCILSSIKAYNTIYDYTFFQEHLDQQNKIIKPKTADITTYESSFHRWMELYNEHRN